jgi:CAAX prenyl protease-like protein
MEWVFLEGRYPQLFTSKGGYNPLSGTGSFGLVLLLFRILGPILVVPFMEELFFRSFVWRWIINQDFRSVSVGTFDLKAFAIVVALFGLEHARWLPGLIAGIVYGWLVWRYRSLWPAVIAHAVTNAGLAAYVVATESYEFW